MERVVGKTDWDRSFGRGFSICIIGCAFQVKCDFFQVNQISAVGRYDNHRVVGHGSQLVETLLGREILHNLSTLTVFQKSREHCGLPGWPRLMLDHEIVGELRCCYQNYCSFCHTEELLLNFTFAKISSRLLFADFLFEMTEEDDDLAVSAAFLFRPAASCPPARRRRPSRRPPRRVFQLLLPKLFSRCLV